MSNKFSKDKEILICKLHDEGQSPTQIARTLGTYNTSIRRVLIRNGHKLKDNSEAQSCVKGNPFKNLSDNETQYWLGFLVADGNISTVTKDKQYSIDLSLCEKDKHHLDRYINFLGNGPKLRSYTDKRFGTKSYSVRFGNKEIHNFLNCLGITPKKSLTIELETPITWPMLRGILDGDGSVRSVNNDRVQIEIATGSEKLFIQIRKFLDDNCVKNTGKFKNKLGMIRICTQSAVYNFYKNAYADKGSSLLRKQIKIEQAPSMKKFMSENAANSGKPCQFNIDGNPELAGGPTSGQV